MSDPLQHRIDEVINQLASFYNILFCNGFKATRLMVPRTSAKDDQEFVVFIDFEIDEDNESTGVSISTVEQFPPSKMLEFLERARSIMGWMVQHQEVDDSVTIH